MLLSTLLTATLTATSAAAAAISIRDESPAGRSYTILGCIEYSDPEYGYKVNDAGSEQVTLEECLVRAVPEATLTAVQRKAWAATAPGHLEGALARWHRTLPAVPQQWSQHYRL